MNGCIESHYVSFVRTVKPCLRSSGVATRAIPYSRIGSSPSGRKVAFSGSNRMVDSSIPNIKRIVSACRWSTGKSGSPMSMDLGSSLKCSAKTSSADSIAGSTPSWCRHGRDFCLSSAHFCRILRDTVSGVLFSNSRSRSDFNNWY